MQFEFVGEDRKSTPKPEDVPTRVSVGGREYEVDKDRCIDAPARYADDLSMHGFVVRARPQVTVNTGGDAPPSSTTGTGDKKGRG